MENSFYEAMRASGTEKEGNLSQWPDEIESIEHSFCEATRASGTEKDCNMTQWPDESESIEHSFCEGDLGGRPSNLEIA